VNYGSRGTGGASCGPATLSQYELRTGNLSYSYTLVPFNVADDDKGALARAYHNDDPIKLEQEVDYTITDIQIEDNEVKNVIITTPAPENTVLILASYDEDGRLIATTVIDDLQESGELTVEVGFNIEEANKVTAFLWDKAMLPLCKAVSIEIQP
jgi:hypothetical protein